MQKYVITGQISAPEAPAGSGAGAPARRLSPKVMFDKDELTTVGFDDGTMVSDFDRVKVDILTLGDL
jgi:hypothetical protein